MPSRDPDDGEIDDVQEFIDSLGEVEYDDVLLSLIGDGGNLDVHGDVVDQQLATALSSWRDNGDREPVRDEAIGQKHPAGGEWPPATTGGTVSIQDDAAQLKSIPMPFGEIQQAMAVLDEALAQAGAILGDGATGVGQVGGAVNEAKSQLDAAYSLTQQVERVLEEVANRHMQG